jgi:hypothetical protein
MLPMGSWARLDYIYAGQWDKWFPAPLKLTIKSFMEKDIEDSLHRYDPTKGKFTQGLGVRRGGE